MATTMSLSASTSLSGRAVVRGNAAPKRAMACRPVAAAQGPREVRKAEQKLGAGLLATLAAAQLALFPLAAPALADVSDVADSVQQAADKVDQKTNSLPSLGDVAKSLQEKITGSVGSAAPDLSSNASDSADRLGSEVRSVGAGAFNTDNMGPESKIKDLSNKVQNATADLGEVPNPESKNLGPNEVSSKVISELPNTNKFDEKAPGRSGGTFGNPAAAEVGKNPADSAKDAVTQGVNKAKGLFDLSAAPADNKPSINRESENLGPNEVDSRLIKEFPNASEIDTAAPGRGGRTYGNPAAAERGEDPRQNAKGGVQSPESALKAQVQESKKSGNFFSNFFNLGKGT